MSRDNWKIIKYIAVVEFIANSSFVDKAINFSSKTFAFSFASLIAKRNLEIVKILAYKLESNGATVYLTRYGDYDLSNIGVRYRKKSDLYNRAKIINNSSADIYISIHLNSTTSSVWSGAQVFYDDINSKNILLAKKIKESIDTKREIQEINNMYFNKLVTKPGVLVELGFLSNSKDRNNLINEGYQNRITDMIVDGIINYFKM